MKQRFFLLTLWLFLLSSCFWWSVQEKTASLKQVQSDGFKMSVPALWDEITPRDIPSPSKWELSLGFISPDRREWYFNNLIVLGAENILRENSRQLMKGSESYLQGNLKSFVIQSRESINFVDGDEGETIVYTASYNDTLPDLVYIQSAKSCGDTAYFMTISVAERLADYNRYVELFRSASCSEK